MLEKLKKVEEKFDFISAELCKSEVVSDMELYKKYMQELKHLSPIDEKYREHKAAALQRREDSAVGELRDEERDRRGDHQGWRGKRGREQGTGKNCAQHRDEAEPA